MKSLEAAFWLQHTDPRGIQDLRGAATFPKKASAHTSQRGLLITRGSRATQRSRAPPHTCRLKSYPTAGMLCNPAEAEQPFCALISSFGKTGQGLLPLSADT